VPSGYKILIRRIWFLMNNGLLVALFTSGGNMNRLELIHMLRKMAKQHGSQKELAAILDVSQGYLSDIINMNRDPGQALLVPLGLRRKVIYLPLEEEEE
jgi:hypothetical protein